jgi:hypothetical protein
MSGAVGCEEAMTAERCAGIAKTPKMYATEKSRKAELLVLEAEYLSGRAGSDANGPPHRDTSLQP